MPTSAPVRIPLGRELVRFFLLAFAITWVLLGAILLFDLPEFPLVLPAIYGPSLAAVLLTARRYGRGGLRRFLGRLAIVRVGWPWYAFLVFGFAAIGYAGLVLWNVARGAAPDLAAPAFGSLLPVIVFQLLVPGLGEELGWRGFALQRLQHLTTPLRASLLLAAIHLLWHLPTYWLGQGIHNVPFVWALTYILPWTVLFTWVYNHTRGSLLVAVLFHGLHGATLSAVGFLPSPEAIPLTPGLLVAWTLPDGQLGPYLFVVALYWVLALAVAAGAFGGLGAPPALEQVRPRELASTR